MKKIIIYEDGERTKLLGDDYINADMIFEIDEDGEVLIVKNRCGSTSDKKIINRVKSFLDDMERV